MSGLGDFEDRTLPGTLAVGVPFLRQEQPTEFACVRRRVAVCTRSTRPHDGIEVGAGGSEKERNTHDGVAEQSAPPNAGYERHHEPQRQPTQHEADRDGQDPAAMPKRSGHRDAEDERYRPARHEQEAS